MFKISAASFLVLTVSACATVPPAPPAPYLPPGVWGTYLDNTSGAIEQSAWAFASPGNTRGNPVAAAKAIVALEYLPGELQQNPRWIAMDSATKRQIAQARDELRRIVGIRPDAPSQRVVNALLGLSAGLQFDEPDEVSRALASPVFSGTPEQTLRNLSDLPYVQTANLATARAGTQILPGGGPRS